MATGTLRPGAGGTHTWSAGTNPDNVDEVVNQPDAGDALLITATVGGGDDNDIEIFAFPTIADVASVSNITVWSNGNIALTNSPEIWIDMGGDQTEQECALVSGPDNWTSNSFDGSWTQADLDGLLVKYRADCPGKDDGNALDVVYVVVTYISSVGWPHKWLGMTVDKFNGMIPDKILGMG